MARMPKPWYRKSRKTWYVTIEGVLCNLGKEKAGAFEKFHELMASPVKPGKVTIFEIMNEFLEWTQLHRSEATYDFYKERLKRYFNENRDMECSSFRPFHVQKWLDGKTWGSTYKAGMVTAIKRCFNWAVRQGYLQSSPIQFLEKPKSNRRETPVTREEYKILLESIAKSDPFYDLVEFCWHTGSRPQESLRFTWDDVDLDRCRIVMKNPKARGPRLRVIHLNAKALSIVQKQENKQGPVFRNTKGKPWTPNSCSNRFDRLKEKVGRCIALYDFRHAYGTDMLKNGVDPLTVAELLGHTDLKMLMETYQHVSQDFEYIQQQVAKRS